MEAIRSHRPSSVVFEYNKLEELEQEEQLLLKAFAKERTHYREILKRLQEIHELKKKVRRRIVFLINRLLIYLIRTFHRARHPSRSVSPSDEDSSISNLLQLYICGAIKGILGL